MVSFIFWLWLILLEAVRPRLLASYSVLHTTHMELVIFGSNFLNFLSRLFFNHRTFHRALLSADFLIHLLQVRGSGEYSATIALLFAICPAPVITVPKELLKCSGWLTFCLFISCWCQYPLRSPEYFLPLHLCTVWCTGRQFLVRDILWDCVLDNSELYNLLPRASSILPWDPYLNRHYLIKAIQQLRPWLCSPFSSKSNLLLNDRIKSKNHSSSALLQKLCTSK